MLYILAIRKLLVDLLFSKYFENLIGHTPALCVAYFLLSILEPYFNINSGLILVAKYFYIVVLFPTIPVILDRKDTRMEPWGTPLLSYEV